MENPFKIIGRAIKSAFDYIGGVMLMLNYFLVPIVLIFMLFGGLYFFKYEYDVYTYDGFDGKNTLGYLPQGFELDAPNVKKYSVVEFSFSNVKRAFVRTTAQRKGKKQPTNALILASDLPLVDCKHLSK